MMRLNAEVTRFNTLEHIAGVRSKLIPGSYRNLKVTTPEDLVTAEAFLRARS